MKISRERWVIIRNDTDIFCGLAQCYKFKPIDDIGDTAIKTYLGKNKAEGSFRKSWYGGEELLKNGSVKAVKVIETIESVDGVKQGEWIKATPCSQEYCNQCGLTPKMIFGILPNFCPHCGAKMKGR